MADQNSEPKAIRSPWEGLTRIMVWEKEDLWSGLLFGFFSAAMLLVVPLATQALVNSVAFTGLIQPIVILSIAVSFFLIVAYALQILQSIIAERIQRRVFVRLTQTKQLPNVDEVRLHERSRYLEVASVQKIIALLLTDGVAIVLQFIVGTVILFFYHPFLAGLSTATVLAVGLFAARQIIPSVGTAILESKSKYKLVDTLTSTEVTQQSDLLDLQKGYLKSRSNHFRHVLVQRVFLLGLHLALMVALLLVGGWLVVAGQLSLGQLVAAELILGVVGSSVAKLPKNLESFYDLMASIQKIDLLGVFGAKKEDVKFNHLLEGVWADHAKPLEQLRNMTVAAFSFAALALIVTPWQQTAFGTGAVLALDPSERPQMIEATVEGRVEHWKVTEGDAVEQGEVLVELIDIDPSAVQRLTDRKTALELQVKATEKAVSNQAKNVRRQYKLEQDGIVSRRGLELAELSLAKARKELGQAQDKLLELENKLARQEQQTIRAPREGIVSRVFRGAGGEFVKKGEPLMVIVPKTANRVVEIWVDGNDAPLLYPKQEVRIQFEGWPALQFSGWPGASLGTFVGYVRMVDWTDSGDGKFRVIVDPPPGENGWPPPALLRQGVRAIAWVQLENVSLGYEIWRRINGFPPLRTPNMEKNSLGDEASKESK
jgi:ABC-type multidrug transport system fused ATPase/permease subunit